VVVWAIIGPEKPQLTCDLALLLPHWRMTGGSTAARLKSLAIPAALVVAVILVIALGIQVRALRGEVAAERRRSVLTSAGQVVPPVWARTLGGDSVLLGEGPEGSRQVLFVFNTTCAICLETLPAWKRIQQALESVPGLSLLGWSQDPDSLTRAYVAGRSLAFPTIVTGVSSKYLRLYRVQGVPSSLVIDSDGNVLYGRPGALTRGAEDSLMTIARARH
jgi:hypothetical protein